MVVLLLGLWLLLGCDNKSIKIMKFSQTFLELTWSQKTAILDTFWSTTEFGIDICYLELLEKLYFENSAPLAYR